MGKLINGQPMGELKLDGRIVLARFENGTIEIINALIERISFFDYIEWAEILNRDPKPDANGWWRMDDEKPAHLQMVLLCNMSGNIKKVAYCADVGSWSWWKPWEGPIE